MERYQVLAVLHAGCALSLPVLQSAPSSWGTGQPPDLSGNNEQRTVQMETEEQTKGEAEQAPQEAKRIIKRYSNRKLYDTHESRYVTLQQIGEMVRRGEDVQIIDNKTKEDKTEVTLALILSEDLKTKPKSVPLGTLRTLIQKRGERLLSQLRDGPIGRLIPYTEEGEDGEVVVTAAEGAEPAAIPIPEPPTADAPATDDQKAPSQAAWLYELVESSRQTLDQLQGQLQTTFDERVQEILPPASKVQSLTQRVEHLDARMARIEEKLGLPPLPVAEVETPSSAPPPADEGGEDTSED